MTKTSELEWKPEEHSSLKDQVSDRLVKAYTSLCMQPHGLTKSLSSDRIRKQYLGNNYRRPLRAELSQPYADVIENKKVKA